MANGVSGVGGNATGSTGSTSTGGGNFESVFAESERVQEEAVSRSLQVSAMRTEAGSAREAARAANMG